MGMHRRTTKHFAAAMAIVAASHRLAAAEVTTAEDASARRLVSEGRNLCARGEFAACLRQLQTAGNLVRLPSTGVEIAEVQASLGLLVEARTTLGRALAMSTIAYDLVQTSEVRAKAQKFDDDLASRLASLRFEVSGVPAEMNAAIWVDESVAPVPAELPLKVNPGRHVVVAKTASEQVTRIVDARERSTTTVALAFNAPGSSGASEVRSSMAETTPASHSLPPAAYVGLGIGAAGFVVGGVTGLLSLVTKKASDPRCAAIQCPPASWNDYDPTQRTLVKTSTVSLIIGAAGLGLALGSILVHRKEAASHSLPGTVAASLRVTPALGGMSVSGKF
jgi:hypothetical protein